MDLETATLGAYPKVVDCKAGHIGETKFTFFQEQNDDKYDLMVVPRCSHCGMPNGADNYANRENKKRFYQGLDPLVQQ